MRGGRIEKWMILDPDPVYKGLNGIWEEGSGFLPEKMGVLTGWLYLSAFYGSFKEHQLTRHLPMQVPTSFFVLRVCTICRYYRNFVNNAQVIVI
jgi:hypothetical protein